MQADQGGRVTDKQLAALLLEFADRARRIRAEHAPLVDTENPFKSDPTLDKIKLFVEELETFAHRLRH